MNVYVIIDTPVKSADLLYKTGYYCLDPFIYIENGGEKIAFLPGTEFEKAKKKGRLNKVCNLSDELQKLSQTKKYPFLKSSVVLEYLLKNEINEIFVSANFPLIEADNLRNHNIKIYTKEEPLYKERVSKNAEEIEYIRQNSKKNVLVMDGVKNILLESTITNDGRLKHNGEILTVKILQDFIYKKFIDLDLYSDTVITSIGDQACDPHETGYGDVLAHQSIVIDIYPRSRTNYYYTDMTRTFCKGKASGELKQIYESVRDCQKLIADKIKADTNGASIHQFAVDFFANKGYKSGVIDGVLQGFFHGTGHGLGLECHEDPYISTYGKNLPENSIVSNEPGLYYLGIGGVRIEDLLLITKDGCENLTNCEKELELE